MTQKAVKESKRTRLGNELEWKGCGKGKHKDGKERDCGKGRKKRGEAPHSTKKKSCKKGNGGGRKRKAEDDDHQREKTEELGN